jgi:2-polyprenyl-3-methyl-5-hydroxy-6-metoxy-1,4-benzoquinol methylase
MNPKSQVERYFHKFSPQISMGAFMSETFEDEKGYIEHNMDRYVEALKSINRITNGKRLRILDIGTSQFTFILKRSYPQAQVYSIDLTPKFKRRCIKEGIAFEVVNLVKERLPTNFSKFDVVTFLEVLEHLPGDHEMIFNGIMSAINL